MTTIILSAILGATTGYILAAILSASKPDTIELEAERDWLANKIDAMADELARLQNENTDILEKNHILKSVIRNLESDLKTAKDSGKLEIIKEMEK